MSTKQPPDDSARDLLAPFGDDELDELDTNTLHLLCGLRQLALLGERSRRFASDFDRPGTGGAEQ